MKKILLSLAVIAMAAGCSLVDEGGVPSGKNIIRVTSDEGTRTEIVTDDDVTFRHNWVEGDAIALFDATDILKYELVGEGGTTTADFTGEEPVKQKAPYYAIYPYKDNIDIYNDATHQSKFLYNFPAELEIAEGSNVAGSNVMIGFTDGKSLNMKNACSYVRVSVSAQDLSFLDELEIVARGGEAIAGPYLVGIDNDGVPFTEYFPGATADGATVEKQPNRVVVKFPESKFIYANSSVFYIPLPAVELSDGLDFNLYGNFSGDAEINLTSSTATLERNNVLVMPDYRITINYALLTDGEHFNVALKKMVNDTVTLSGTIDNIIKKITFKVNEELEGLEGTDVSAFGDGSIIATLEGDNEIVIHAANPDIRTNADASYMYSRMQALETVEGWDLVDTKMSTTMRNMFWNARVLKDIDLSHMDTRNNTNMWSMFCNMFEFDDSLFAQIKGWNTENLVYLTYAFAGTKITAADLSCWDLSSLYNMNYCFQNCDQLTDIDWSGYSFPSLKYMYYTFDQCDKLKTANISGMNLPVATDISYMFNKCTALETADASNMNIPKVEDISRFFYGCTSLKSASLANCKAGSLKEMRSIFYNDAALETADMTNLDVSTATNINYLFYHCTSIKHIDLSTWDFSSWSTTITVSNARPQSIGYIFTGCTALESIDMSKPGWDFGDVTGMYQWLDACPSLKEWKLGKDCTMEKITYHSYSWRNLATSATTSDPLKFYCSAAAAQSMLRAANSGNLRTWLKKGTFRFYSINNESVALKVFYDGTETTDVTVADNAEKRAKITVTDPAL